MPANLFQNGEDDFYPSGLRKRQDSSDHTLQRGEILSALSYALDLTEGQDMGHTVKSALLGIKIGALIHLSIEDQRDLYYALLLKDAGCSSNAARVQQIFQSNDLQVKRNLKTTDWTNLWEGFKYVRQNAHLGDSLYEQTERLFQFAVHKKGQALEIVQIRCQRGSEIAEYLGFSPKCAQAIYSLDEHWDGKGVPQKLRAEEIPLFSRVMNLTQTMEVFFSTYGKDATFDMIEKRSGTWFDPQLVQAARELQQDTALWATMQDADTTRQAVMDLEPPGETLSIDSEQVTLICEGFASIIDAKSPWTARHSENVTLAATSIARQINLPPEIITTIRHAALLHDIGKLALPNSILDKNGPLTEEEFDLVRKHPYYTLQILKRISTFEDITEIAASHHERLDGHGYFRQLSATELSLPARILAVADVFDALRSSRPYRDALTLEETLDIMRHDTPHSLCPEAFGALEQWCNSAI